MSTRSVVYPAVDCQGLAGAWSLGSVQTGRFDIVHRVSQPGGFGDEAIDANRHLLGYDFEHEDAPAPEWVPVEAAFVHGTPPCSGFSLMNASKGGNKRGPNSPINSCMRDLAQYGGRCTGIDGKRGAEVVAFESVQGAFSQGRGLMQNLRGLIEEESRQAYDLTHVKMSGASIGAAQARHRYYFVAHRVPFGVDRPEPQKVGTYADAIGDLATLPTTLDSQPYADVQPSRWVLDREMLNPDGTVDWHMGIEDEVKDRFVAMLAEVSDEWEPGESFKDLVRKLDEPPEVLLKRFQYTVKDWKQLRGWQWPRRIEPDKPGYVVAGGGAGQFVHWSEPRLLTVRELSRLMGYPDTWAWPDGRSIRTIGAYIGKNCPVTSGKWLSNWVARALDGDPGKRGELIGDREYLHDSTLDYRRWPKEISQWEFRPKRLVSA